MIELETTNINELLDITDSLYKLYQIPYSQRKELIPIIEILHPNIKNYCSLSIGTESLLTTIKDKLTELWEWLMDKIKELMKFFNISTQTEKARNKIEKNKFQEFKKEVNKNHSNTTTHDRVYNVAPMSLLQERFRILQLFIHNLETVYIPSNSTGADKSFMLSVTKGDYSLYNHVGIHVDLVHHTLKFVRFENLKEFVDRDGTYTLSQMEIEYKDGDLFIGTLDQYRDKCYKCLEKFKQMLEQDKHLLTTLDPQDGDYTILKYKIEAIKVFVKNTNTIRTDLSYINNRLITYRNRLIALRNN